MTTTIPLQLGDTLHHWRDCLETRIAHQLRIADSFLSAARLVKRGRPRIPLVAARNVVIDRNLWLSTLEIVRRLDLELSGRDGFVLGLPESWTERLGVSSYREAYKNERCRRRLASMISKRRRISTLL